MKAAIRYHSKFGHTRQMVEAVKDIVGCEPQTVDTPKQLIINCNQSKQNGKDI